MQSNYQESAKSEIKVLILGGGFGGIRTALDLQKMHIPKLKITLVSDKHHFEYTPSLYRLATGRSPLETCIPLGEIFSQKNSGSTVEHLVDTIVGGSLKEKIILGKSGSRYQYDYLILALGAETAYFNIPGIAEHAFTLKSVSSALKIKNHMHALFNAHKGLDKKGLMSQYQFVVVGGGPAGVELAGEIRKYALSLAKMHGVDSKYITIDIIQAAPRLLPTMNEEVSSIAVKQLDKLGINILLNKAVTSEDDHGVFLKDIQFNAKTIIWTAGVKPSSTYSKIEGLTLDKSGHILVKSDLSTNNFDNVFAIGDSASTPHAGTAQTAISDGQHVAKVIKSIIENKPKPVYETHESAYVVPVGPGFAIFSYKNFVFSGKIFWWLRKIIDFRFFLSILPLGEALIAWREGGVLSESCPTCHSAEEESILNVLSFPTLR